MMDTSTIVVFLAVLLGVVSVQSWSYVQSLLTTTNPATQKSEQSRLKSASPIPSTHPNNNHSNNLSPARMQRFYRFQRNFEVIFLSAMMADWMQGPYVYRLYQAYGFSSGDIALLFVVGFGSSALFGPFAGSVSDLFGRKKSCLCYCIFYGIACITRHSRDFTLLVFGRLLSGISTSILFSSFEAWLVSAHSSEGFPPSLLGETLGHVWTLNSLVAVLASLLTQGAVSAYPSVRRLVSMNMMLNQKEEEEEEEPSEVAAFDCALIVLVGVAVMIATQWDENYGSNQIKSPSSVSCSSSSHSSTSAASSSSSSSVIVLLSKIQECLSIMKADRRVLFVGCIQSCFEGAMFIFVFLWTPLLQESRVKGEEESSESSSDDVAVGFLFSILMLSCMLGTSIQTRVLKNMMSESLCSLICTVIASLSLLFALLCDAYVMRLTAFVWFEVCVGVYWRIISGLRCRVVKSEIRATMLNLYRIPLNVFVVAVLLALYADILGHSSSLVCAILLMCCACGASALLHFSHPKQ